MARPVTLRVQPPVAYGDVSIVPALLNGQPELQAVRAMAGTGEHDASSAAVHVRLRKASPLTPLSARLAALGSFVDRVRRPAL